MSTLDESGVYYTPSAGFQGPPPDNQHPGHPQDALKPCSVKGCTDKLLSNDQNKMCEGCRSRHRIYASTKRARRKLEKAALTNAVAARNGKDIQEMSLIEQPVVWVTNGHQDLQPSTSTVSTWNNAIDPRLFSGNLSPVSAHHLSPPRPHQTSTSSELANALTPRQPVLVPAPVVHSSQTATDYSISYLAKGSIQPHTSVTGCDSSNDNVEEQVSASLRVAALQDQHMGESNNLSSNDRQSSETTDLGQSNEAGGSARFCSVKGCKAVIPVSYEYKMCPLCRTRYRMYGNTKRTKWKAERNAFDREMASLRTGVDEKTKSKPLAECPEELSSIDGQAPADKSTALSEASSVTKLGLAQSLSGMNPSMVLAGVYSPNISSSSTVHSPHAISHLNKDPLLAAAANTSLPARMCTVSHCHKILPGYYRYKRCEQHRLQNRHHSQLKRVREKEVKAAGPEEGATLVEIPSETEVGGSAEKNEQAKAALTNEGKEAGVLHVTFPGRGDSKKAKSHDRTRSNFSCSAGECHNLLLPTVRWRSCELCRSIDRQRKNQLKLEQKAAAEKNYWSSKMNTEFQAAAVPENQDVSGGSGTAQESQQIKHAVPAIDPDAEGDIDMGENVESEESALENQQPAVSLTAASPPSIPPESLTSGFSRFHVTIDLGNTSSPALDPTTSTAKLVTLDDPLAFRAYRPKTTPSAIGRILARNPGLSVDAFTEVLQAESSSTEAMTLPLPKQENTTSTTKPIITPTIPTSAPFVYKAPEKKNVSTKGQEGTTGKGKRRAASSEKQPTASTTPASVSGVSSLTASALPRRYGTYGYHQYPYPYYMPSAYGMPSYPYPQAPAPVPSDPKHKPSSKTSMSVTASSSSPTHIPSTAIPGYPSYLYPYPQPYGYPYMPTRIPGQQPYNGLSAGPSGNNPYPYPYYPPVSALLPTSVVTSTSAPFPKTAAAARERQRTQDTKFNYYHYGIGSSDSPTMPNDKKNKRRKVNPDYLEKFQAQTEAISMSLAMDQARRDTLSSAAAPPPALVASDRSHVAPPVVPAQVETTAEPSTSIIPTRPCANKTCRRSLPVDTPNTLCDKCRLRFKKHQAKTKKRFKLEPRKFLLISKATSEKQGSADERMESTGFVE